MTEHEAGIIHTWTFDQSEVWVNIDGEEIAVDDMPLDYIRNVLLYLIRNARRFRVVYYDSCGEVVPPAHLDALPYCDNEDQFAKLWILDKILVRKLCYLSAQGSD